MISNSDSGDPNKPLNDHGLRPIQDDFSPRTYSKTPLYTATNSARYHRQALIKEYDQATGNHLLCYVCGKEAEIDRDDVIGFVDLLHNIHAGDNVDLLLHTGGGDIDAAEKLIRLVQMRVSDSGRIRVIIPDHAKSAGTLMALGGNSIVMSDTSELGAIDPQFSLQHGNDNEIIHSVLRYLEAYSLHEKALKANPEDPAAQLMFDKFDPVIVEKFRAIRDRARDLAENLLKPKGKPYTKIADDLMNIHKWRSHSQMISADDAIQIGLDVEKIPWESSIWQKLWQIHCLLRISIGNKQKVFESYFVSLPI